MGDLVGTVQSVGARSTQIKTWDGVSIIVPNSRFLESEVINWSHGDSTSAIRLPIGVAYGSDIKRVRVALLKAARESIVKLEKYFRFVDLHAMDDRGKPIYTAKDLINNLEKMGRVVDGLTRLEDIVKKEEQAANTNRGGIEVNKYSM